MLLPVYLVVHERSIEAGAEVETVRDERRALAHDCAVLNPQLRQVILTVGDRDERATWLQCAT